MNNYQPRPNWPPVAGFNGPLQSPQGQIVYTNLQTGMQILAEDLFPKLNGLKGPLSNPHDGSVYYTRLDNGQAISHAEVMVSLNQSQPVPYANSHPSYPAGNQMGVPPSAQPMPINTGSLYTTSAPSAGMNDAHLHGIPSPTMAVEEPPVDDNPWMNNNPNQLTVGVEAIVLQEQGSPTVPRIAHNTNKYQITPLINQAGKLVDVIHKRSTILNKNEHLIPDPVAELQLVETALEEVEVVEKNPLPATDSQTIPNCDTVDLGTEKISQAAVIARHYKRSGNSCIAKFTHKEEIALVSGAEALLQPLTEDYWIDYYHDNYTKLMEQAAEVVGYLDHVLIETVNNILLNILNLSVELDGTFLEDKEDLEKYLTDTGMLDRFNSIFQSIVQSELNLSMECMVINDSEIDMISIAYSSVLVVDNIEPLDDLTLGKITFRYTPKLYEAAKCLQKAMMQSDEKYYHYYIAGTEGGVVKVTITDTNVSELTQFVIVDIIR